MDLSLDIYTMFFRLNPFFIRSAVGIGAPDEFPLEGTVLIPSSSGLRLELFMQPAITDALVLIPSSSGLRLESCGTGASSRNQRLNPFFIRSAVGIEDVVKVLRHYTRS